MSAPSSSAATLNVSLEEHLVDTIRPLTALLPGPLAAELSQVLDASSPPRPSTPRPRARTIPYALLTAISKWSRSAPGEQALASHAPPLRVQDYTMLALLAGTRTSPERLFPHIPMPLPGADSTNTQAARRRELGDRRAVTAVVNALLSIAGAAVATWWAAERLGWRNEWVRLLACSLSVSCSCPPTRMCRPVPVILMSGPVADAPSHPQCDANDTRRTPRLPGLRCVAFISSCQRVLLALSVAIVVASSEAVLYLIWEDRRSKSTRQRREDQGDKKHDADNTSRPPWTALCDTAVASTTSVRVTGTADVALRERTFANGPDRDRDRKIEENE